MKQRKLAVLALVCGLGALSIAAPITDDILPGFKYHLLEASGMNGIAPKDYGEFWKTWNLVNVRYRKDNNEQRFIWANDIAWKALQEKAKEFPEGSVFAKVAFHVREDPLFNNSLQPAKATRVQYMRKNKSDYPKTNSWGYALYVPDSKAGLSAGAAEDIKDQMVCHACHVLAKDRDYVFSRPAFIEGEPEANEVSFRDKFQLVDVDKLPDYGQKVVVAAAAGKTIKQVKWYSMALFLGALHESIGPLSDFATKDHQTYLLLDTERKQFLFVSPSVTPLPGCTLSAQVVMPLDDPHHNRRIWRHGDYCDGKNRWQRRATPVPPEVAALEKK